MDKMQKVVTDRTVGVERRRMDRLEADVMMAAAEDMEESGKPPASPERDLFDEDDGAVEDGYMLGMQNDALEDNYTGGDGMYGHDGPDPGEDYVPQFTHDETVKILMRIKAREKRTESKLSAMRAMEGGGTSHILAATDGGSEKRVDEYALPAEMLARIEREGDTPEKIRILYKMATEKVVSELEHRLELLRLESRRTTSEKTYTEQSLQNRGDEMESLRDCVRMLRKKHKKLEHECRLKIRKLDAFKKFDPIYRVLETKYGFTSPKEVVRRLTDLEQSHARYRSKQENLNSKKVQLERERAQQRVEHQERISVGIVAMQGSLKEMQSELTAKEIDLEHVESVLRAHRTETDAYLTLYFAVVDMWNHWEQHSALIDESNPLEIPDKLDGCLILASLHNVLTMHVRERAEKLAHDFSVIANHQWLKYFPEKIDLKGKPQDVMIQVSILLETEISKAIAAENEYEKWNEANQKLQYSIDAEERDARALAAELDRWKQRWKWSSDRRMVKTKERAKSAGRVRSQAEQEEAKRRSRMKF